MHRLKTSENGTSDYCVNKVAEEDTRQAPSCERPSRGLLHWLKDRYHKKLSVSVLLCSFTVNESVRSECFGTAFTPCSLSLLLFLICYHVSLSRGCAAYGVSKGTSLTSLGDILILWLHSYN